MQLLNEIGLPRVHNQAKQKITVFVSLVKAWRGCDPTLFLQISSQVLINSILKCLVSKCNSCNPLNVQLVTILDT